MNPLELYRYVERKLNSLAVVYDITNLNDYFCLSDFRNPNISSLNGIPQVFAQFALHIQNGTMISNIVKFNENYSFIKRTLCDFRPAVFLDSINYRNENDRNNSVSILVEKFRFNNLTGEGMKWSNERSVNRPDQIIIRFSNALIDGAVYFKDFETKQALINDMNANYHGDHRRLIKYLLSNKFKHGLSVALCCDFLKELDTSFDLPKPDIHLMDFLAKYKNYPENYYGRGIEKAFECLDDFNELVNDIRTASDGIPSLTAYKFDRMIWLCCTANFFITEPGSIKDNFLKNI